MAMLQTLDCSLTHWGRATHISVGKLIIIGWDNGLSPDRRQAIISTNAGLLSIGPFRTYFSENLIKIQQFSLKKMHMKMSSAKWRPSCLGLNVLTLSAASGWMDWGWGGSIHPSIHPSMHWQQGWGQVRETVPRYRYRYLGVDQV